MAWHSTPYLFKLISFFLYIRMYVLNEHSTWIHWTNRARRMKAFNQWHHVFYLIEIMSQIKKKSNSEWWNAHGPTWNSVFSPKKYVSKLISFGMGVFFFGFVTFKRLNGPSFDFIYFSFNQLIGSIQKMRRENNVHHCWSFSITASVEQAEHE